MIVEYSIQSTTAAYVVQRRIGVCSDWLNVDILEEPLWMFAASGATEFMNIADAAQVLINNVNPDLVIDFVVLTEESIRARSVEESDQ